jgi:hypothetical protein
MARRGADDPFAISLDFAAPRIYQSHAEMPGSEAISWIITRKIVIFRPQGGFFMAGLTGIVFNINEVEVTCQKIRPSES